MIAQIINGKFKKGHHDSFTGPFTPGSEIVWLPDTFMGLLDYRTEPDFIAPDDPRLTMDPATLALVNSKTRDLIQKPLDIETNLPSWAQVETYLDGINTLAEARTALKKIARVVYWLAKGTEK